MEKEQTLKQFEVCPNRLHHELQTTNYKLRTINGRNFTGARLAL
jgi:hypothetical protein